MVSEASLNSRIPRPSPRASSGNFFPPNRNKATMKIKIISWPPIFKNKSVEYIILNSVNPLFFQSYYFLRTMMKESRNHSSGNRRKLFYLCPIILRILKNFFAQYKPYYRSNLQLAGPIMISQLGHTMVHTADSVIVGHFAGTIPLAAV